MRKSSSSSGNGVKLPAKQREKLLDMLRPNINTIVKDGVEQYIGAGTKFMLELLMHAEARERCGDWHSRSELRELVR